VQKRERCVAGSSVVICLLVHELIRLHKVPAPSLRILFRCSHLQITHCSSIFLHAPAVLIVLAMGHQVYLVEFLEFSVVLTMSLLV
jgi:hypothetical protein